mgnify:CR=1 FL=1
MRTLLLSLVFGLAARAEEVRVYYGTADDAVSAMLDAREVFSHIPEYATIVKQGYSKQAPEYWILLERANRRFYAALHRVARRLRLATVVEGRGRAGTDAEDVTPLVVAELSR